MDRRSFMAGVAALSLPNAGRAEQGTSLKDLATRRGLYFGTSVTREQLGRDPAYAHAVRRECEALVCGWDTKWEATEAVRAHPTYADADWLFDFCMTADMRLRGHPLVWAQSLPSWLEPALANEPALPLMLDHVRDVVKHFKGKIRSWDVVNEAIEPREGRPDGLRSTVWLKTIGPSYLDEAFKAAHAVDPEAELVYNDAELDYADEWSESRRRATLRLLDGFRRRKIPCDALGIQAHLWAAGRQFDEAPLAAFLNAVAAMGYRILITELDVNDRGVTGDVVKRDRAVADMARRYLDVVLSEPAVKGILTWGLTDRYTWLNMPRNFPEYARQDGIPSRPLPLDDALRRKPFWDALAAAFRHAPDRVPA